MLCAGIINFTQGSVAATAFEQTTLRMVKGLVVENSIVITSATRSADFVSAHEHQHRHQLEDRMGPEAMSETQVEGEVPLRPSGQGAQPFYRYSLGYTMDLIGGQAVGAVVAAVSRSMQSGNFSAVNCLKFKFN